MQWAKACRSIPLQGAGAGVDAGAVAGAAADPRGRGAAAHRRRRADDDARHRGRDPHHPNADHARTARFPRRSRSSRRRRPQVAIGIPIDIPFTDINKIVEAQFAGRTFPEDGSGSVNVTVKRATVAAVRRPAIDLAAGERQGEVELLRFRRRSQRAYLGPAGARSGAADAAAHQHSTRRRIGSRIRTVGRGGARGDAASAEGAGRQGQRRSQAIPRRSAEEDRGRDRRTRRGTRTASG